MEHYKLVLPENLNHYGYLFGGKLLEWVDEIAYISTNLDFPGHEFVTVGLDNVEFKRNIKLGSILKFTTERITLGNTSVTYIISVYCETRETGKIVKVFQTRITFVSIDKLGQKKTIVKS